MVRDALTFGFTFLLNQKAEVQHPRGSTSTNYDTVYDTVCRNIGDRWMVGADDLGGLF